MKETAKSGVQELAGGPKDRSLLIALLAVGTAAVAVAAVLIFRLSPGRELKNILRADAYDRVQVMVTMTVDFVEKDESAVQNGDDGLEEDLSAGDIGEHVEELAVIHKQGDLIYESGSGGEYYFFTEEGTDYALYLDDMQGFAPSGKWTKVTAADFSLRPAFDFAVLSTMTADDWISASDGYVPADGMTEKLFFKLLNISEASYSKYSNMSVRLVVNDGRLAAITAQYDFRGERRVTQSYTFAYEDVTVELPAVDVDETAQ
ncbi:MAG: hypothetical protein ACLSS9_06365 [Acutalibacteraceae bacterium]